MNQEVDIEELAPWLVVILTLVGGGLRVLLLGTKGMWLDETFSVWLASHGVGDMLQWIVKIDQHPPLYYFLLHYWIALNGDKPYYARLLSVLFGAGTIPMIYLIGKRISGATIGLAAAAILAFSPYHIYYAQEARMYTLLMFNAAVAIYALVRLLTDSRSTRPIGSQFREYLIAWRTPGTVKPGREDDFSYKDEAHGQTGWRAWISRHFWSPIQTIETDLAWVAFIAFSAATLFSHNTAVLFPLATNIFVLGLMLFQRIKKPGAQPAFQAPSFWNWAKAQVGILILWIPWIFPFIKQASGVYQRFWIPAPTWDAVIQVLRSFLNASGPIPAVAATVTWILYALVFCLGLVYFRKKISQILFLAALFAIPLLGELIVSIWRPIFYDRTLIWITIPLFLLLAAGITQLRFRFLVLLALGSLCTINLLSVSDYYHFYQKEDWNTAARNVAGFAEGEIPGLISLLKGHYRVWLVYSHDSYTDPNGIIPQTLASQMKLIRTEDFYGGQVQLYTKR